jgi:ABC-type polysaccharide/polyol phosphate export permease
LFYLTPIIYAPDSIPHRYQWLFKLNPLIYALNGFRLSVYYGMLPAARSVIASFACGFLALIIGFGIFRRHQHEFVFHV